jgi:hypothetical protein
VEKRSTVVLRQGAGPATVRVSIVDEEGRPVDAIPDLLDWNGGEGYHAPRVVEADRTYEFSGLAPNRDYRLSLYTRCERVVPGKVRTLDHVKLDHRINLRPNETREVVVLLKCRAARVLR